MTTFWNDRQIDGNCKRDNHFENKSKVIIFCRKTKGILDLFTNLQRSIINIQIFTAAHRSSSQQQYFMDIIDGYIEIDESILYNNCLTLLRKRKIFITCAPDAPLTSRKYCNRNLKNLFSFKGFVLISRGYFWTCDPFQFQLFQRLPMLKSSTHTRVIAWNRSFFVDLF